MSGNFLQVQRSRREVRAAVMRAMSPFHWRRPADIARAARLPIRQVRRCLHELAQEMLVVGCVETESAYRLTSSGALARLGDVGPTCKSPRRSGLPGGEVAHG